jgi:uncharacterized protein (DUF1684 family)
MSDRTLEQLLDYRRRVSEMYARVRHSDLDHAATCRRFRRERDELFRMHPQSALADEQKAAFKAIDYFAYDPALRFVLPIDTEVQDEIFELELQEDGLTRMRRFGKVHFEIDGQPLSLSLFWIMGYGGGVFLPFRDATNRHETYGGGRYLLDTIKHADLGQEDSKLVIDFNYAYNPSCAYNPRWICPLAPAENRLPAAIRAGEKRYPA